MVDATSPTGNHGHLVPSELRVMEIDPQSDARWTAFVSSHPDGCVYHHPAWLETLGREYRQTGTHLACEDQSGNLHGVLPLLHTRGLPLGVGGEHAGRRLTSLPRTPVAGPLTDSPAAAAALVQEAVARTTTVRGAKLQLKAQRPDLDGVVSGLTGSVWGTTYVLELPDQPDQVRFGDSRNHGRIKWAVKKAAKEGVVVRPADTIEDLRRWYALYLSTMRSHLVPPRPFRLFAAMWDVLRPLGLFRLLVAEQQRHDGPKMLAGSIFLMFGRTVFYAFNGRDFKSLSLRPNDVIQWHAIHRACEDGFRRYDMGEVEQHQAGLADFKTKWGAEGHFLHRYYFPELSEQGEKGSPSSSLAHQVVGAAWRHMPLKVTAFAGHLVFSYL